MIKIKYVFLIVYEITFIGESDDANVSISKFRTTELDAWDTILGNEEETEIGKGDEAMLSWKLFLVQVMLSAQWPLMMAFVIAVVLGMHRTYCGNVSTAEQQKSYLNFINDLFDQLMNLN